MASLADLLRMIGDNTQAIGEGWRDRTFEAAGVDPYAIGFENPLIDPAGSPNERANLLLTHAMAAPRFVGDALSTQMDIGRENWSKFLSPQEAHASEMSPSSAAPIQGPTDAPADYLFDLAERLKAQSGKDTLSIVARGDKTITSDPNIMEKSIKPSSGNFSRTGMSLGEIDQVKNQISESTGLPSVFAEAMIKKFGAKDAQLNAVEFLKERALAAAKNKQENPIYEILKAGQGKDPSSLEGVIEILRKYGLI